VLAAESAAEESDGGGGSGGRSKNLAFNEEEHRHSLSAFWVRVLKK